MLLKVLSLTRLLANFQLQNIIFLFFFLVGIRHFLNATQLHASWLRNNGSEYQGYLIIDLYIYAQDLLSTSLTSQSAAIDLPLMLIATLLLIQVTVLKLCYLKKFLN